MAEKSGRQHLGNFHDILARYVCTDSQQTARKTSRLPGRTRDLRVLVLISTICATRSVTNVFPKDGEGASKAGALSPVSPAGGVDKSVEMSVGKKISSLRTRSPTGTTPNTPKAC